jgi:hypothetical protein
MANVGLDVVIRNPNSGLKMDIGRTISYDADCRRPGHHNAPFGPSGKIASVR